MVDAERGWTMRTTRTAPTDYEQMTRFARAYIGQQTRDIIDAFAAKRRIGSHRAGKVFWALVDDGAIHVRYDNSGLAYIAD